MCVRVGAQEVPQKAPLPVEVLMGVGAFLVLLRMRSLRVKVGEAPSRPPCPVPRPLPAWAGPVCRSQLDLVLSGETRS